MIFDILKLNVQIWRYYDIWYSKIECSDVEILWYLIPFCGKKVDFKGDTHKTYFRSFNLVSSVVIKFAKFINGMLRSYDIIVWSHVTWQYVSSICDKWVNFKGILAIHVIISLFMYFPMVWTCLLNSKILRARGPMTSQYESKKMEQSGIRLLLYHKIKGYPSCQIVGHIALPNSGSSTYTLFRDHILSFCLDQVCWSNFGHWIAEFPKHFTIWWFLDFYTWVQYSSYTFASFVSTNHAHNLYFSCV